MAFETIHRPLLTESRKIYFPNNRSVSVNYNGAFCKVGNHFQSRYDELKSFYLHARARTVGLK